MADDHSILRVSIDGHWTAAEFSKMFDEMELLNELAGFGLSEDYEEGSRIWAGMPIRFAGRPFRFNPTWASEYDLEFEAEEKYREIVLRRFLTEVGQPSALQVTSVQYASPGGADFFGAGRVVGHISKFIIAITDRYLYREDRALAREQVKQGILKQKIANAEGLLKLGAKVHLDDESKRALVRRALELDESIERQVIEGKITGAETIPIEEGDEEYVSMD